MQQTAFAAFYSYLDRPSALYSTFENLYISWLYTKTNYKVV